MQRPVFDIVHTTDAETKLKVLSSIDFSYVLQDNIEIEWDYRLFFNDSAGNPCCFSWTFGAYPGETAEPVGSDNSDAMTQNTYFNTYAEAYENYSSMLDKALEKINDVRFNSPILSSRQTTADRLLQVAYQV